MKPTDSTKTQHYTCHTQPAREVLGMSICSRWDSVMTGQSHELWSLWDMLRINASKFTANLMKLNSLQSVVQLHLDKNVNIPAQGFSDLIASAREIEESCGEMGLDLSAMSARRVVEQLARLQSSEGCEQQVSMRPVDCHELTSGIAQITSRIQDEFQSRLMLIMPASVARFYEPVAPLFGDEFKTKFPAAQYDLDETGKCLALGRYTAAVFHMLKVIEHCLRAVHACLGINVALVGNDRNWGNIINRIRDDVSRRGARWAERDLFQELLLLLTAVKDAWRNATMHAENKYTEEEATTIFASVRGLASKIAARMDESGGPSV